MQEVLQFIECTRLIHEMYLDEKVIAHKEGKIRKYNKKWKIYQKSL